MNHVMTEEMTSTPPPNLQFKIYPGIIIKSLINPKPQKRN